jgi:predicted nucleic acid-binding protein
MTFVIDASVAIKWYVREPLHEEARALLRRHFGELNAPDFIIIEVSNVAWRRTMQGLLTPTQAFEIEIAIRSDIAGLDDSVDLASVALRAAIDLKHPVYDCLYLACAEANDGTLITTDRRLLAAVRGSAYAHRVRHLIEVEPAPRP